MSVLARASSNLPDPRLYSVGDRMINEYGAVGGMRIGRGNRSNWRKPTPLPLRPPQIQHYLGSNPEPPR
jgi:hypothetical protein